MASSAVVENSTNHSDVVHHARPRSVNGITRYYGMRYMSAV